jgi:peroxiredoxin
MEEKVSKNQLWIVILYVIVVAMGIEIIYLILQNRRLQQALTNPRTYFRTLTKNQQVPSFRGADVNGKKVFITYTPSSPHTIIFWFSPGCHSCDVNIGFWTELYQKYQNENLRFFGLCVSGPEETRKFIKEFGISFPVIMMSDPILVESYKGNVIPQTLLIDPEGKVKGAWPGPLEEKQKKEILELLDQTVAKGGERK